jgi:hypothetical protein
VAEAEKEITLADFGSAPSSKGTERTTSYPQGEEGKAPVVGASRTTSYKSSIQYNTRGYETIN